MWNLDKPRLDDSINDLTDIASHSRTFKTSHIKSVEDLYRNYDSQNGHVTDAQHNTVCSAAQTGLRNAYDKTSRKAVHASIKTAICAGVDKCPLCAVGNANTLDHFLEKSQYKALSMMRQNLVPMCRDCNSNRESNKVKPSDFIHAYYDILPDDIQWLKVSLKYSSGAVSATFYPDRNVLTNHILYNKAEKTIDGVEFNSTVGKELHSFLSSTLSGTISTDDALRVLIKDKADSHRRNPKFGLNHWKTVLLMGLASNATLAKNDLSVYL